MTTQNTPTNKPTNSSAQPKSRGTWTAAPRARDEQRSSSPRPASSWLVSVGIAAALVAATWLAVTGVIDEYELAPSARADQTSSASQKELADHEVQQFNNRAEAHRRHRANQQREQQLTDPSADHEIQQFNNRAEAHRRHRANQQREQQLTTNPSADHEIQQFNNRAEAHRRHRANQQREQQLTTNPSDNGSRL